MTAASERLVDILTPTYDHEKYIAQCIEGVLAQRTNFRFRQIIGEDASKDSTRKIIASYADRYPDVIVPRFRPQNVGAHKNSTLLREEATAKYITILEGDDYWTDPYKLQKQVDFLENNPGVMVTGHAVKVLDDNTGEFIREISASHSQYSLKDYVRQNIIPTCSAVFRNHEILRALPEWFYKVHHADRALFTLLAEHGNIYMFKEVMAVYRVHGKGLFSGRSYAETKGSSLEFLEIYEEHAPESVKGVISQTKSGYASTLARIYYDQNNKAKFREYYKYHLSEWLKSPSFAYDPPQPRWLLKYLFSFFS